MKFINLTKHEIKDFLSNTHYPTPNSTAVVNISEEIVKEVEGTQIIQTVYGEIVGLPEPKEGVMYIVSAVVLNSLNGTRNDCVSPAKLVKNSQGTVIGCRGFRLNG